MRIIKQKIQIRPLNNLVKVFIISLLLTVFHSSSSSADPIIPEIKYVLLIDQDSGEVLLEKNADERIFPSSMTKLMTAYVIFEQLKSGKLSLDNQCVIGKDAWKKNGSKMLLGFGDVVAIRDLLTGLVIASGNDAAVALAEAISGSIGNFASLMNETSVKIGMTNSNFKNPHGLYEEGHYTTLRDLAILSTRITKDFPEYFHYFSTPYFTYRKIKKFNHNPLIKNNYPGATGMKTGYTVKGGYGMVGTATRKGRNLIAITNGLRSSRHREIVITGLLDYGFSNFQKINLFTKGQVITNASTWLGSQGNVDLVINKDVFFTVPASVKPQDIVVKINYKSPIYVPISQDQKVADLKVFVLGKQIANVDLFAGDDVDKLGYLDRIHQVTKYKFNQFLKLINL